MWTKNFMTPVACLAALACAVWTLTGAEAAAQGTRQAHNHSQAVSPAPHGGQVTAVGSGSIEVVYQPRETRVYLYGPGGKPLSARGVQGQAAMRLRGNDQVSRYPLSHAAAPAGSTGEDYLAVAVDLSRVRDGDMTVTFELTGLPLQGQTQATFTQTFALARTRPAVTVATVTEADQEAIARQQVCPVMGTRLGDHGRPLKAIIGDQALYLCCKGCLGRLKADPEKYLAKAAAGQPRAGR